MTKDRCIVYMLIKQARQTRDQLYRFKGENEIIRSLLAERNYTCRNNAETARRILYDLEL